MKTLFVSILLCGAVLLAPAAGRKTALSSPSGKLTVEVSLAESALRYSVSYEGRLLLSPAPLSMTFDNGVTAGRNLRRLSGRTVRRSEAFEPVLKVRNARAEPVWNETEFNFGKYSVIFRVYDDAVCYRFVTRFGRKQVKVLEEEVVYDFSRDDDLLFPRETSMHSHQENVFLPCRPSGLEEGAFCGHPLVATDGSVRMLVTEADLESYPGIYYRKYGATSLKGIFPYYPLEVKKTSDRDLKVVKRADYMAETAGDRAYPWRVVLIMDSDTALLESNTLYSLAAPSRIADPSWIKPGKVAWDWWNAMTLTGVDFESGVNTATYRRYIDFAAAYGLEYIILDEGWYDIRKSILDVVDGLDLEGLIAYGEKKGVGVLLWTTWLALEENKEAAFEKYKAMGIRGFKIDFMQRDDQWMVDWYYDTARRAAELKLLIDYHGSYKPTGFNCTWPNILNSEGVHGSECNKWSDSITPEHDVTLPFTRMALGPMDYTPGAMRNSLQGEFVSRFTTPMSQGTRCHQLGMYVVYEAPLQMLCDSPSNYEKEPEMMAFLSAVPTVWDETHALQAALGDYVVVARRNGDKWWIGGMTDWTAREVELKLDFLEEGAGYAMTLWQDGKNVHKNAEDFSMKELRVMKGTVLRVRMAPGGGLAAVISKITE